MTQQLWLRFRSDRRARGIDTIAGFAEIRLAAEGAGQPLTATARVPIEMTVYPFTFPASATLAWGVYDYTAEPNEQLFGLTTANAAAVEREVIAGGVHSPTASWSVLPAGVFDTIQGSHRDPPDARPFPEWARTWKRAGWRLNLFMSVAARLADFLVGGDDGP
jgi:hypothetical protein